MTEFFKIFKNFARTYSNFLKDLKYFVCYLPPKNKHIEDKTHVETSVHIPINLKSCWIGNFR